MCVCDGVAIPDNQNYITERWLRGDRVSMIRYASAIGAAEYFNFKKTRRRTAAIVKIEKSRYLMMMQNGPVKVIGRPPSWIFGTKFVYF